MTRAGLVVPLVVFALLCMLLYFGFSLEDPHRLPSALVGQPFPSFELPVLDDRGQETAPTVDQFILDGRVSLVNVWATWCPTCKAEHEELMRIHRDTGLPIIGINYKDDAAAAKAWLARYGNPYELNIIDADGRLGIDLGVYGAPETFIVDADGTIVYKRVGDVNRRIWDEEIAPLVAELDRGDG